MNMLTVNRGENRPAKEFFAEYIRKNSKAYIVVLSIVLLFEAVMIVRAGFVFNFTRLRHRLYLASYIFLFLTTLVGLYFIVQNRRGRASPGAVTFILHLYCVSIIAWSLLVSYLDLTIGNTPIVYLTVIMSVGGLSVISPAFYAANLILSYAVLLSFNVFADIPYFRSGFSGSYINLFIFVIVSFMLALRNYSVSRREQELSNHLHRLSFRDQLTDVFNRRMYDGELRRIDREDAEVLGCLVDLDSFKTINDTYGHEFGDACLTEVAARLRDAFGERIYRIGGDEFAVICEPDGRAALEAKVNAVNRALEKTFPERGVSISAGFSLRGVGGRPMDAVMEEADAALYAAKGSGKKRCCFAARME
ncbi:MAG: diguanylate cyclase [Ruminococcaceae bacterium]|nr:diguanylate cyclase [Oscillospiraceae bacterium]